jgi:hypothetical protein
MEKNITKYPNLKEIEQTVWRQLQDTYSLVMQKILQELDQEIAQERDKKRFRLIEKRSLSIDSLFGEIKFKRNYYYDRESGEYVCLLDRYLEFEGTGTFSPLVEEAAIELAINGPSYRKAAQTLQTLLGYRVISHETIRQHLLQAECISKKREPVHGSVLFVEVDGIYIKRQGKGKRGKGKETKIAAVHQGWEVNGKRVKLKNKRHYIHRGTQPFWEGFEEFLMEHFEYDPTKHKLVINGDGAGWIVACREHFKDRVIFTIDRYHVAKAIQSIFRTHPRYRAIRKALASNDAEKLFLELNSAIGTLEDESKENALIEFIRQLEQYPEALVDYRVRLKEQGIDITGMRPMGSAEATMSVFAKRLKNGRSWVDRGVSGMLTGLVACLDKLALKTMFGRVERWNETKPDMKPSKYYTKKIASTIGKATRDNLTYLKGKANTPIYRALKALAGF